jgi:hypothetical protein
VHIEQQKADAGAEVMQVTPDQGQDHQLDEAVGQQGRELREAQFGGDALLEQVQNERKRRNIIAPLTRCRMDTLPAQGNR